MFLLHVASNAIEYRILSLQMHNAEVDGNDPLIIQYIVQIIWESIWVTNVYYSELEYYQAQVIIQPEMEMDGIQNDGPLVQAS